MLEKLHASGMSIARLNFSHGTDAWFQNTIAQLHALNDNHQRKVSILVDTKGPEMRTCDVETPIEIVEGGAYSVGYAKDSGADILVDYPHLLRDVPVGQAILIDGGTIIMHVTGITEKTLLVRSEQSGQITSRRHVNVPSIHLDLPILDANDKRLLALTLNSGVDMIAMSFVNTAAQVEEVRAFIADFVNHPFALIAKIETQMALDNIESIASACDGIMIARGDLAMEIPLELLPTAQRHILSVCHRLQVPCIIATHMMKSMTDNPTPTRAEILDVGHAVYDGTDAVMTSEETSVGHFPAETIGLMARISAKTEESMQNQPAWETPSIHHGLTKLEHIRANLAASKAEALIYAASSFTAVRLMASLKLPVPCIAVAQKTSVARYAALNYGQYGLVGSGSSEKDLQDVARPLLRELFGGKEPQKIAVVSL